MNSGNLCDSKTNVDIFLSGALAVTVQLAALSLGPDQAHSDLISSANQHGFGISAELFLLLAHTLSADLLAHTLTGGIVSATCSQAVGRIRIVV